MHIVCVRERESHCACITEVHLKYGSDWFFYRQKCNEHILFIEWTRTTEPIYSFEIDIIE